MTVAALMSEIDWMCEDWLIEWPNWVRVMVKKPGILGSCGRQMGIVVVRLFEVEKMGSEIKCDWGVRAAKALIRSKKVLRI